MFWVTRDKQGRWVHLHEGSRADMKRETRDPVAVSGQEAHKIVKADLIPHSTALYVDEGRIRRATGGE
ncbi:hypothetical protein [Mesorhizobium sp. M8A.F.Ca.ET.021.01.1.1]|uniref:hypothetical protein n=1 Tax=Mesorhizobium sp. M8A.F.Ca.ET.021.01.1.1 TaxID=2496757 RepID=UPI000FCBD34A|nr:hypothetical protein [Mesorhizobium sp. M8A.F.Ca.ET.021.01.1.1]RUW56705.1 hypothetical protein EOA36_02655 [Mesorhizobium sp. M8A.F.Ca.ET.021.01.1.1]